MIAKLVLYYKTMAKHKTLKNNGSNKQQHNFRLKSPSLNGQQLLGGLIAFLLEPQNANLLTHVTYSFCFDCVLDIVYGLTDIGLSMSCSFVVRRC